MNFRRLQAFRAVMAEGSVTRAGHAMHISQPAVSRLLADLEADLGVALFARDKGRLIPTPEAELLHQEAELAFSGLERLNDAAQAVRGLRRGQLRIICETVYAEGLLPRLAAAYHAANPDIAIEIDIGPSTRVAEWVALTWYDLGLVVLPMSHPELTLLPLGSRRAVCAVPSDHPLAERASIRPEDLEGQRFISLVSGTPFRSVIDRAFDDAGIKRDIHLEARTQHALCAFVASGAGCTIVDPCLAEDISNPRIAFRRFEPEISWSLALALPRNHRSSMICQDFAAFVERNAGLVMPG
ncbi:MAG: LysR substrate-binding domain-containing protein [Rhodovibrionaceae bacterium]